MDSKPPPTENHLNKEISGIPSPKRFLRRFQQFSARVHGLRKHRIDFFPGSSVVASENPVNPLPSALTFDPWPTLAEDTEPGPFRRPEKRRFASLLAFDFCHPRCS